MLIIFLEYVKIIPFSLYVLLCVSIIRSFLYLFLFGLKHTSSSNPEACTPSLPAYGLPSFSVQYQLADGKEIEIAEVVFPEKKAANLQAGVGIGLERLAMARGLSGRHSSMVMESFRDFCTMFT